MSTAARARGAAGAVLAGYTRDTRAIAEMKFPVFCCGSYGQDQRCRGMVVAHHVQVELEGVLVQPGDILFGDHDGVVVIPRESETEAIATALRRVRTEQLAKKALAEGNSVVEVFQTYKVL
jgi:4-hydroxy-4-methyl-2-oxoglutarate aldolase